MSANHPPLDELSAWVDGEIGGELDRRGLAEHVAACPWCTSLVEDFRALARAQAASAAPPLPARLKERVMARLAQDGRGGRRGVRRYVVPLSAAATVLVGVTALWLVRHRPEPLLRDTVSAPVAPAPQAEAPAPLETLPSVPAVEETPAPAPVPERKQDRAKVAAKEEAREVLTFAPPPRQETSAADQAVAGGRVEQHSVALKDAGALWTRIRPSADDRERDLGERQDAFAKRAAAPSVEGAAEAEACSVIDRLEPALTVPSLDAVRGTQLAERARAAGATVASLAPPRLTLIVPASAWSQVWQALVEEGIAVPDAARAVPEGAGCLMVTLEGRP